MLTVPAGVSADTLRRWTLAARRRLPPLPRVISLATIGPTISRRLNRRYRRQDRPTNVLSFLHRPGRGRPAATMTGEILLCPAVIGREARRYGQTNRHRVRSLLGHGLIHLLGYDHRTAAERRRWQTWEERLTGGRPW